MVINLILLLAVSIVGMILLLGAKRYELVTGHLMFAGSRPKIAKFSHRVVFLFGTAIPLYVRWQAGRAYGTVTSRVHKAVARGAVKVEHWLESTLENVREKTAPPRTPGEASSFLREVAEHKKKLTHGSSENRIDQE